MDPERSHLEFSFSIDFLKDIKSGLLRQMLELGSMTLVASILQVLLYIYASRNLGPEGYGEFGVLVSLVSTVLILLSSFYLIINKFMAQYESRAQEENIKFLIKLSFWDSLLLGFASFILSILLSRVLAEFLQLSDSLTVVFFGVLIWISFMEPVLEGVFKGMQSFKSVGAFKIIEAVFRISLLMVFLWLGWGVNGALLALAAGSLIGVLFCLKPLYRFKNTNSNKIYLSEFYKYALPVISGSFAIAILLNLEIILIKHFFPPEQAGFFAAAAAISKLPFLLSASLGSVMFSRVAASFADGKPTKGFLRDTMTYFSSICGLILLMVFFFSKQIARAVFGPAYDIGGFLPWYTLAFVFFGAVNLFMLYDFARKKYGLIWMLFLGLIVEMVLLLNFHQTLTQVVLVLWTVMGGLCVLASIKAKDEFL